MDKLEFINTTLAHPVTMTRAKSALIEGDAMRPEANDLLAQRIDLAIGEEPRGLGWRILTGNRRTNLWARVCYRHELP